MQLLRSNPSPSILSHRLIPLLAVAVMATSCGSSTDNGGGSSPTRVRGTISFGGSGVADVDITLREGPSADRTVTTTSEGAYEFTDVTPGNWELVIEPPPYFALAPGNAAERPVVVVAEETSTVSAALQPLFAGAEANVNILNNETFDPLNVTVTPGTVVQFTNTASVTHNVTPFGHSSWGTRVLSNGQSTDITVNNVGVLSYTCTLHSGMSGQITVALP